MGQPGSHDHEVRKHIFCSSVFLPNRDAQVYISSDVDKKNPWKGLESRAGNLLGAITMPVFAAHVYVNFRFAFPLM